MKVERIEQIWTEKDLAAHFGVRFKEETGKSRTIGAWVSKGLRVGARLSGRRYFFEPDVVEFFKNFRKSQDI